MSNIEKYNRAFVEVLGIAEKDLEGLAYQSIKAWDSVGHMALIAAIEEAFDIMMDTEDILEFSSYEKGKELLRRYDVQL